MPPETMLAESSTPLDKFELFPKLPVELQLKIWGFAMPGPRLVEVRFKRDARYHQHKFFNDFPVRFSENPFDGHLNSQSQTLLHVCKQTRYEVQKTYQIAFNTPKSLNKCYFNFKLDTLHIPGLSVSKQRHAFLNNPKVKADMAKVQNLVAELQIFNDMAALYGSEMSGKLYVFRCSRKY